MAKLIFSNFLANLTRFPNGDLDSGKAVDRTTYGAHAWAAPGVINFTDKQTDITGIVEGVVIDGKPRTENGVSFMYVITHLGYLYKIQVNNPETKNIMYDTPSLLKKMTSVSTFTMGGSLIFFTGKILVGHDGGVSVIDFDGENERAIGDDTQWITGVPRQGKILFRNVYFTNGNNISKIDPTLTVKTYTTISELDDDQIFKTIEVDKTGQLLILVSSNVPTQSLISVTPNVPLTYPATSYVIRWDPRKEIIISTNSAPFEQTAAMTAGPAEYIWGCDVVGGGLMDLAQDLKKITSGTGTFLVAQSPCANATASSGNLIGWAAVEPFPTTGISNVQGASFFIYGKLDEDEPTLIYTRLMSFLSSLSGGDIIRIPWVHQVGSLQTAGDTSGYGSGLTKNQTAQGRIYMSTVEFDGTTTAYKLYSLSVVNAFANPCAGVYETQAKLAGTGTDTNSTYTPSAVDVYLEPCTGYEQFTLDLIGIDGLAIASDSHQFINTSIAATGTVALSANPSDADTVTINDGVTTKIFEFDNNASVGGGHVLVTIGADAAATAAALATAIAGALTITVVVTDATCALTNTVLGTAGNHTITKSGATITVTGMAGGLTAELVAGATKVSYTPSGAATAALGVRVTNSGLFTPFIHKVEVTI